MVQCGTCRVKIKSEHGEKVDYKTLAIFSLVTGKRVYDQAWRFIR